MESVSVSLEWSDSDGCGWEQDLILRSFLPVVIGSTYKVQPGDTLSRIAARLRTTVKKILEVNPDMHSPEIEPNQVSTTLYYDYSILSPPHDPLPAPPPSIGLNDVRVLFSSWIVLCEQEVCVMPCTEESYKEQPINPYNGAAINGVGAAFVEKVPRLSKDPNFVAR